MRRFALIYTLIAGMLPIAVQADDRPVVVELFTSQGCSSCPPADRLLTEIAKYDDVIALAWHVDYWDYLGWKDDFADPAFSLRQKKYARAMDEKMVYTPQMIFDGTTHTVGSDSARVMKMIDYSREHAPVIELSAERDGDVVSITAEAIDGSLGQVDVSLVHYLPEAEVEIRRGENAGRTIRYTNIVTAWAKVGTWNGRGSLELDAPVKLDQPIVVLLQERGTGPILAAVDLE